MNLPTVTISQKGDFKHTEKFLAFLARWKLSNKLKQYGERGVRALASATPVRTGLTADSWYYEIEENSNDNVVISWKNSNVNKGVNIAILIQYGHGTGTGGYVKGIDYINPAIQPIFNEIAEAIWGEVTSA